MGDPRGRPYGLMLLFAVGANLVFALCRYRAFFDTLRGRCLWSGTPVRCSCVVRGSSEHLQKGFCGETQSPV